MNILVTGLSGFVGSNLKSYFSSKGRIVITPLNLREHLSAHDFNESVSIIHLAGKAHDLKKTDNDNEYFKVNTDLTKDLFDIFLENGTRDFIYFSSVKAVADVVEGVLYEDIVAEPKTAYGRSKRQAEEYLQSKKLPDGKRLFIIRPCMIHGPGNKGNLNLLYNVVKKGIPYPLAAFKNERSFLSISNLMFIIEKIISDSSIPGGIYNVADDTPLATNDVIRIISQVIGIRPKLWSVNPSVIRIVARLGDKLHLPLNSERLNKLTENYIVSNEKIKRAMNINQLPASSKEGLVSTIESFQ